MTETTRSATLVVPPLSRSEVSVPANFKTLLAHAERAAREARRAADSAALRAAEAGERSHEARTRVAELLDEQKRSWSRVQSSGTVRRP